MTDAKVEITYRASQSELRALAEQSEDAVNEWCDAFEAAVKMTLHGRYGYTGEIDFDWTLDA